MNAIKDVRVLPMDGPEEFARTAWSPRRPQHRRSITPLMAAIVRARQRLLGEQQPEGHWVGQWEESSAAESETILMLARFGLTGSELARQVTRSLASKQLPGGGWARHPGEAANLNDSVKACLALKVMGYPPGDQSIARARAAILAQGGASRVDGPTRLLLALFGQVPFDRCPRPLLERVLLARWLPLDRAEWDAPSAPAAVAMALASAVRPVVKLAPAEGLREFFLTEPAPWSSGGACPRRSLRDRVGRPVRWLLDAPLVRRRLPLRRWAVARIERWLVEHVALAEDPEPNLAALLWTTLALDCLGYAQDTREVQRCFQQLETLVVRRQTTSAIAPRRTPIHDTAQAVRALMESGAGSCRSSIRCGQTWLVDSFAGSAASGAAAAPRVATARPDGGRRPGVVSTAIALAALRPPGPRQVPEDDSLLPEIHVLAQDDRPDADDDPALEIETLGRVAATGRRASVWLAEQHHRDGGWSDVPRDCAALWHRQANGRSAAACRSWPDITGLVLAGLGAWSYNRDDPFVEGGICYLRAAQQADGSWPGRTPAHSIQTTSLCIAGLRAVGVPPSDHLVEKAVYWLLARQQPSGAWGESAQTDADPRDRWSGPTTASHTAWAVNALTAAGLERHPAVVRGVRQLLDAQESDGRWIDAVFVSSLFPEMSHGRNNLDATCSALGALARWAKAIGSLLHEVDVACRCLVDPAERDFDGP